MPWRGKEVECLTYVSYRCVHDVNFQYVSKIRDRVEREVGAACMSNVFELLWLLLRGGGPSELSSDPVGESD